MEKKCGTVCEDLARLQKRVGAVHARRDRLALPDYVLKATKDSKKSSKSSEQVLEKTRRGSDAADGDAGALSRQNSAVGAGAGKY